MGLSISEGAKIPGVSRQALNHVIAGKSDSPETWLLAGERKDERKIKVRRQHIPQEVHVR